VHERVLVDTNVLIYVSQRAERGWRYSRRLGGSVILVPFVAVAELLLNARRTRSRFLTEQYWRERLASLAVVWPNEGTCELWAQLMASSQALGAPREDNDIWIAACALQHDLPLMTHNPRHFEHIEGLRLIHEPDPES